MINKKDLAKKVAKKTIFTQQESLIAVEAVFNEIVLQIIEGNDVSIVGFGKFYSYQHSKRPVRNPKTQEEMILKPNKTMRFKASNVIKEAMKELSEDDE
jgi:DNA-binding protein HU-beta